jgi:hypothetical protein
MSIQNKFSSPPRSASGSANFIGVGNRSLSGIVYRIKVAYGRSKQSRHSACG